MSSLRAQIGPSILNADLSSLAAESNDLLTNGADYLHLDVMDGHFVPNLTFGHPLVACLRRKVPVTLFDMHMMVSEPKRWIRPMSDSAIAQYTQYTFHLEALNTDNEINDCIRLIREAGMRVGLAIKPNTPVERVLQFVELDHKNVDCVLIMTVEPGFGGQSFMANMMSKVEALRQRYRELDIEVDGGVGPTTIKQCADAGANWIVSGTAVIGAQNRREVMQKMREEVNNAIQRSQLER